jgi:hypothetical protein
MRVRANAWVLFAEEANLAGARAGARQGRRGSAGPAGPRDYRSEANAVPVPAQSEPNAVPVPAQSEAAVPVPVQSEATPGGGRGPGAGIAGRMAAAER